MSYEKTIERLMSNGYRPVQGIEVMPSSRDAMWISVEVSPFSIYRQIELIKMLLPDFLVRSGGTNSGVGIIYIQSK